MLKRIVSGTSRCNGIRYTSAISRKGCGPLGSLPQAASGQHFIISSAPVASFATAPTPSASKTNVVFDASTLEAADVRKASVIRVVRDQVLTHKDAFYVVDLNEVAYKYAQWQSELPRVRPFYAVKCNDDPRIVQTLAALGSGFDCASKGEMSMVLGAGVKSQDIIFAHPAKQTSHLHYARAKGVTKMTFDNEDELVKIAREHPGAELVLRILPDDSSSVCRLGLKFGCPPERVREVLTVAKKLNLNVIGVSYHVGSGNGDASAFAGAVREARAAFDVAADLGMNLRLLDIGGGFPGSEMGVEPVEAEARYMTHSNTGSDNPYAKHPPFTVIARAVRSALDTHFPAGCGVDIIGEPGRYFVKSTHTLAVNVVGKRLTVDDGEHAGATRFNYYVNDGLYGSFNCVMYDHVTCSPQAILKAGNNMLDLEHLTQRLAAQKAAAKAAPVTGDDTIAVLGADGRPVVSDAVGLQHAVQLAESVVPKDAAEQQDVQVSRRRLVLGGGSETEDDVSSRYAYGASAGLASASSSGAFRVATAASSSSAGSASHHARGVSSTSSFSRSSASSGPASDAAADLPKVHPTTLWGPTCDSIDKVSDNVMMPELAVGDWVVFQNMGAYTIAGSCKFNGFPLATKVYIHRDGKLEVQEEAEHD